MSIDLDWDTVTSGPDGAVLADRIRTFIHDKFQTVPLPRFIKSVTVHGFDFGTVAPRLDLKDITDPLPDFYDEELDDDEEDDSEDELETMSGSMHERERLGAEGRNRRPEDLRGDLRGDLRNHLGRDLRRELLKNDFGSHDLGSPFLGTLTPGIMGSTGMNYFQGHLGTGAHTPLAAVAGAHLGNSWLASPSASEPYQPSHSRHDSQSSVSVDNFDAGAGSSQGLREKSSVSTLAPTSTNTSRPPTRDMHLTESAIEDEDEDEEEVGGAAPPETGRRPRREPRVEDVQAVLRIQYSGDIKLNLTAEILLDYPMPSFVGIPLKLSITGMSFDGVGILANIRKRLHFCFLSPEDALAAVGPDEESEEPAQGGQPQAAPQLPGAGRERKPRFAGLLQEIKVESEIGEREGGKQSLKNVGKVERFVLEQVRRIFEEEFVYPSFWTFLV